MLYTAENCTTAAYHWTPGLSRGGNIIKQFIIILEEVTPPR
jgi:hypothetical protein